MDHTSTTWKDIIINNPNEISIKVKKLYSHAQLPYKSTSGAAGFDLTAIDYSYNPEYGYHEFGTGLAVEIPEGYVGKIYPRSSITKTGFILGNCVGIIDSDFRGEVTFRFRELDANMEKYEVGDRIGQLILVQLPNVFIEEVTELSPTMRDTGGYGSTGK